ncbi:MAG TPA: AMP-binding protein, partial [Candidatus Brocadiaceae bacterium]|nr:AMP-binding protein [Candidatus Brocadiaceae bacterium]
MNKKIVHTVFEATAERFPDRIAVETGSRSISYSALKSASDNIARRLRSAGVQKEVIVGTVLKSGIEYVATIIGVLKAGGVFLPLDMEFPDKRLEYILNTTVPGVVITGKEDCDNVLKRFKAPGIREKPFTILAIDDNLHLSSIRETDVPESCAISEDLGLPGPDDSNYIMYTSGSTGEPKAIVGCHKSLSHFMHWEVQEFGFDEQVKVSQFPPVTFDASLRDIFVPLITGGRVCIPEKEVKTNVKHLIEWL